MFVDLDFIKKNILQRIQRRIPRSEIVHGNADIPIVEEADRLLVIGGNLFPHHAGSCQVISIMPTKISE